MLTLLTSNHESVEAAVAEAYALAASDTAPPGSYAGIWVTR